MYMLILIYGKNWYVKFNLVHQTVSPCERLWSGDETTCYPPEVHWAYTPCRTSCNLVDFFLFGYDCSSPPASVGLADVVCSSGQLWTQPVAGPPSLPSADWTERRYPSAAMIVNVVIYKARYIYLENNQWYFTSDLPTLSVLQLMAPPPFEHPPRYIRARLYHYHYTHYEHDRSLWV